MSDPGEEPAPADSPEATQRAEPTLGDLLRANLRVCLGALALALVAFGAWWLLRWLFPDVEWLR